MFAYLKKERTRSTMHTVAMPQHSRKPILFSIATTSSAITPVIEESDF